MHLEMQTIYLENCCMSYFEEFNKTIEYLNNKNEFIGYLKYIPIQRDMEEKLAINLINKLKLNNIHLVPDILVPNQF